MAQKHNTSPAAAWPLPAVVPLGALGPLGTPLSRGDGQSKMVCRLDRHEGWLLKLYRSPADAQDSARLDRLVSLPGAVPEADRTLLRTATSWPVARVTDQNATVGCVIPAAPPNFRVTLQASATSSLEKYLLVDWLAMPDATLVGRGVRVPSETERLKVCRDVVAVAACLERHQIVYSDWSYANTFWDPLAHVAFVIDIDGCGKGSMTNIFQPNWEDPLTARSAVADGCTDRFRVALLVARCLTGLREARDVLKATGPACERAGVAELAEVLLDMLLAADRRHRPTLDTLHSVMQGRPYFRLKVERVALPPLPTPAPAPATTGAATQPAGPASGAATVPAAPQPAAAGTGAGTPPPPAQAPGDPGGDPQTSEPLTSSGVTTLLVLLVLAVITVVAIANSR
ncbi:hypothetical protein [Streptomyces cavernae]|uniref:hypothetical protein n=1 Tax=Streptomyces cavernae TaxID=2259034 RepID=UPI000FEBC3C7|nr:hypothetical protein [Streptomyces cavernae]